MNDYTTYPRNGGADANYPDGKLKDSTTETSRDGSPVLATLHNDVIGAFSSILADAGESANGSPDSVGNPQILDALKVIINTIGETITPIGAIMALHKDLSGVPALPGKWLECNGQTISDSESPLNGQTLPDLNGENRFLRGGSTSGTLQDDAFQGHHHSAANGDADPSSTVNTGASTRIALGQTANASAFVNGNTISITDAITDGVNGTPRTASETRPKNMFVVWIIRIK